MSENKMSSHVISVNLANGETVSASDLLTLTEAAALPEVNKTRQAVHAWTMDRERPLMCVIFMGNPYTTKAWVDEHLSVRKQRQSQTVSATEKRQARKMARMERELKAMREILEGRENE